MAEAVQKIVLEYIAKTDKIQAELKTLQGSMQSVQNTVTDTNKNITSSVSTTGLLKDALYSIVPAMTAAFAVAKIKAFISESLKLANAAQDIKSGFEQINDPLLLSNLKSAVKGTIDEVTLMKKALEAKNLQIPIQNLAKLFEFAKLRADQTGKSTEALIDSLVNGIGVKSKRALVQVGISQDQFNQEVQKSGDYFTALSNIIDTELGKAGEQIEDTGDKVERMNAEILDLKESIGEKLLPVQEVWLKSLNGLANIILNGLSPALSIYNRVSEDTNENFKKGLDLIAPFAKFVAEQGTNFKTLNDALSAYNKNATDYVENIDSQGDASKQAAFLLDKQYSAYLRQIRVLNDYVDSQNENNKTSKETISSIDEVGKKVISLGEIFKIVFEDIQRSALTVIPLETIKTNIDDLAKDLLAASENEVKIAEGNADEVLEYILNKEQQKQDAYRATLDTIIEIQDIISEYTKAQTDYRLSLLEDQNEKGLISDKQFANEKKKLLEKQANADRRNAIFETIIQSAVNITKAIETLNPAIVALVTFASFAQLGSIIATPVPKFAKGTERVKGGVKKKDSVFAMLMPDEAVIKADQNMKNPGLAKAWNAGKLDEYILKVYAPKLMAKSMAQKNVDLNPLLRMLHEDIQTSKDNTHKIIKALDRENQNRFRSWK